MALSGTGGVKRGRDMRVRVETIVEIRGKAIDNVAINCRASGRLFQVGTWSRQQDSPQVSGSPPGPRGCLSLTVARAGYGTAWGHRGSEKAPVS